MHVDAWYGHKTPHLTTPRHTVISVEPFTYARQPHCTALHM